MVWVLSLTLSLWFYLWAVLEVLNWIVLILVNSMLLFLIWQSLAGLLMLFGWVVFQSSFFFVVSLIFKSGMIPAMAWVLVIKWKWNSWMIFLTFHKMLPFLFFMLILQNQVVYLSWIIMAVVWIYCSSNWFGLMWASSLSESAWMCILNDLKCFWVFFFVYVSTWWGWSVSKNYVSLKSSSMIFNAMLILLLALPFTVVFFLKVIVWMRVSMMSGVLLGLLSWLMVFFYFKWYTLTFNLMSLFKESVHFLFWCQVLFMSHVFIFLVW